MGQHLLSDLWQVWSTDLQVGNSGDAAPVTGTERGKQRVLRRLLTNPGDYIFQPDYGAGLPRFVGGNQGKATLDEIEGLVRSQILMEAVVAADPAPEVSIQRLPDFSLWVWIAYTDAPSATPVVLDFTVGNY
jgi:hypothetical protein